MDKKHSHRRKPSLFQSLSNATSGTVQTYGSKSKSRPPPLNSVAGQTYLDKKAWKEAFESSDGNGNGNINENYSNSKGDGNYLNPLSPLSPMSPVRPAPNLEKLDLDTSTFGVSDSWEAETTQVLKQITSNAPSHRPTSVGSASQISVNSSSTTGRDRRLSRLVRALSTVSTSSASSRDTIVAKRASQITVRSNRSAENNTNSSNNSSTNNGNDHNPRNSTSHSRLRRNIVSKSLSQLLQVQDDEDSSFRISDDEDEDVDLLRIPSSKDKEMVLLKNRKFRSNSDSPSNIQNSHVNLDGTVNPSASTATTQKSSNALPIPKASVPSWNVPVTPLNEKAKPSGGHATTLSVASGLTAHSASTSTPLTSPNLSGDEGVTSTSVKSIDSMFRRPSSPISVSGSTGSPPKQKYTDNHATLSGKRSVDMLSTKKSMDFGSISSKKSMELNQFRNPFSSSSRAGISVTPSILSLRSTSSVSSSTVSFATNASVPVGPNSGAEYHHGNKTKKRGHAHKLSVTLSNLAKKTSFSDMKRFIRSSSTASISANNNGSSSASNSTSTSAASSSSRNRNGSTSLRSKDMISLPTPSESSREKLNNKLRANHSLLSLARPAGDDGESLTIGVPAEEYEKRQLNNLLDLCSVQEVQEFETYVHGLINNRRGGQFAKLAEASFSEVYVHANADGTKSTIYKVVPFGDEDLGQMPAKDIAQELEIAKMLMDLGEGYCNILRASIVQGLYPLELLDMWDAYNEDHPSENIHPSCYKDTQYYCIMVMEDHGVDLEHFELTSWDDAASIFWQTVKSLAAAEKAFQFEHRDLHWGNLVISEQNSSSAATISSGATMDAQHAIKVTLIDYTLSRATSTRSAHAIYTRMDHPDFFRGKSDYQFDIYRLMRSHLMTRSGPNPNWSLYCPKTNIMWLHYLIDKLLYNKGLVRRRSKAYDALELLHGILDPRKRAVVKKQQTNNGVHDEFGSASELLAWAASEGLYRL